MASRLATRDEKARRGGARGALHPEVIARLQTKCGEGGGGSSAVTAADRIAPLPVATTTSFSVSTISSSSSISSGRYAGCLPPRRTRRPLLAAAECLGTRRQQLPRPTSLLPHNAQQLDRHVELRARRRDKLMECRVAAAARWHAQQAHWAVGAIVVVGGGFARRAVAVVVAVGGVDGRSVASTVAVTRRALHAGSGRCGTGLGGAARSPRARSHVQIVTRG